MMHGRKVLMSAVAGLLLLGAPAALAASTEPRTEAGVLAADDEWLADELRGDAAALDARLADGYRDIEPDGKAHVKAELVDRTARRTNKATGIPRDVVAAFRKAHPVAERVTIFGDTAVLSFHSTDPAGAATVRSVDVFTYDRGMWRGVLSNHSAVAKVGGS